VEISLTMDKFRQLYSFEKHNWAETDYKQIVHFANSLRKPDPADKEDFPKAQFWKHKSHTWSYCSFELNPGHTACLGYGFIPSGQRRASFQLNPSKLTKEGLKRLTIFLWRTLSENTYAFVHNGHIGSAEIACDIEGASFGDFWFLDPSFRCSNTTYQARGTVYLGAQSSSHAITCYAKDKELLAKQGLHSPHPILRIEAEIKPPKPLALNALPTIPNPFANLIVVDAQKLAKTQTHHGLKPFRRALEASENAQFALHEASRFAKCSRNEICNRLQLCMPDWWNPEAIWSERSAGLIDWVKELVS
jgi:hypothetical protein